VKLDRVLKRARKDADINLEPPVNMELPAFRDRYAGLLEHLGL
jgi:hypothetical protein